MPRILISLPDGLAAALKHEAHRRSVSASAIVREALEAHIGVGAGRRKRLAFVGLVRSGHTDTAERFEEVLAEEWERDRVC